MSQFLRLALGLASALNHLHKRNVIHKDVKPGNFLVDFATGHAWILGFGIASRLLREHQSPEPPEFIAGTLPYMAPEQTGRMNRSIDSRSDLYAFGVMLYEMLTVVGPSRLRIRWDGYIARSQDSRCRRMSCSRMRRLLSLRSS